jgi:hypothetical protein
MAWCPPGGGDRPPVVAPPYTGPLTLAERWNIIFSPGMPLHPLALPDRPGWSFDFPTSPGSVHYVITTVNRPISGTMTARVAVVGDDYPVFNAKIDANNQGPEPANCSLYFQRRGDKLTAEYPYHRWFSLDDFYLSGEGVLSVPLEPSKWISVFGKNGAEAPGEFQAALRECANVGLVFGGGWFEGHGVNLTAGKARFILEDFQIQ